MKSTSTLLAKKTMKFRQEKRNKALSMTFLQPNLSITMPFVCRKRASQQCRKVGGRKRLTKRPMTMPILLALASATCHFASNWYSPSPTGTPNVLWNAGWALKAAITCNTSQCVSTAR